MDERVFLALEAGWGWLRAGWSATSRTLPKGPMYPIIQAEGLEDVHSGNRDDGFG